jgi:hypothetical protein
LDFSKIFIIFIIFTFTKENRDYFDIIHILFILLNSCSYYEIFLKPVFNKTKIQKERIGLRDVVYKFNTRGSIEIIIACSKYPFPIETDDDVNNFFVFLGKVHDRLTHILNDPRERPVLSNDSFFKPHSNCI